MLDQILINDRLHRIWKTEPAPKDALWVTITVDTLREREFGTQTHRVPGLLFLHGGTCAVGNHVYRYPAPS